MGIRRRAVLAAAAAVATVPFAATMAASAATTSPGTMGVSSAAVSTYSSGASAATVITTEHTKFGTVLETGSGASLYNFSGDNLKFSTTGVQLNCTALNKTASGEPCTTPWIPLQASSVVAKGGVQQKHLGTVTRDGVKQVTYFGHPLYTFIADTKAHDVNGEDVSAFNGQWYLTQTNGLPQAETPTVSTEISPNGIVLSSPTASGTRSLYMLTEDGKNMATCGSAGGCDALWPPLLTTKSVTVGTGAQHLFSTVRRSDGTIQVTYHGHPLYFFALDLAAGAANGETNGEHLLDPSPVDGVWYNLLPSSNPDAGTANIQSEASGSTNILADAGVVNGVVATLYEFSADKPTMSNCSGACATAWPPVLTQSAPTASGSAKGSLLGAIPRSDGTFQVTYNGHPLYYFAPALDSGTQGAGVKAFGGTFNTVNVSGAVG